MTEINGVLTQLNHALPSGLDATRLAQWRLRDGRPYAQVRADVVAALDGLNRDLLTAWGDMVSVTFDDYMEYPNGGAVTDMPIITDLDRPTPRKGSTVGHMLPLNTRADAIGGTKKFFRDAREKVVLATIRDVVQRGRQTFEKSLLTRFFTDNENALGSSGYELGFASASASVTYTPPAFGGNSFLSTHTHYVGYNASTPKTFADVFEGLAKHVAEHGHAGPYIAYVSETDVATIRALANFVKPISNSIIVVDRGGATSGNDYFARGTVGTPQPLGGYYIGSYVSSYGEIELRATARLATGYVGLYKSYGVNDPRNPLAIRVHPDTGFGFRIIEEPSHDQMYPIQQINIEIEYGVSCGMDRTVGAAGLLVAGGAWADATIA